MKQKPIIALNADGQITIPRLALALLGWNSKTVLTINSIGINMLTIAQCPPFCVHCGGTKDLKDFNGSNICAHCRGSIAEM